MARNPEGNLTDDSDPNREHVATISQDGQNFTLDLERVTLQPNAQPVWLFSKDTVAAIPGIQNLARSRSQPVAEEEVEVHDPAPNPEVGLAQGQRVERLRRAIRRLPLVYRQVIMLSLEGLGYGEIAEVLGISESNVGVRLTRARQILREGLENQQ